MKLWRRRPPLILSLVVALLLLLPVLAFLQYRWLGQVSQAERERMLANLQRATAQFRQDFDRELTRAFFHFQALDVIEPDGVGARAHQLLGEWKTKAPHPRLISDLYWVELKAGAEPAISRLDAAAGVLQPAEWPEDLGAWRKRIKSTEHDPGSHLRMFFEDATARTTSKIKGIEGVFIGDGQRRRLIGAPELHSPPSPPAPTVSGNDGKRQVISVLEKASTLIRPRIERIIEEAPAISVPVFRHRVNGDPSAFPSTSLAGYLVARIDVGYLKKEILPALSERYFGAGNGLEYHLLIVNRREPREVIYQTDPSADPRVDPRAESRANLNAGTQTTDQANPQFARAVARQSDGSAGIFAIRIEEFGNLLTEALPGGARPGEQSGIRSDRMTLKVFSRGSGTQAGDLVIPEIDGYWQVFLKHKAGSLEAAVGSVRRRSLAISFGILLLLGASVGLLLVATRRAQRLAEQQMEFVAGVSHELRTPLAVIRSAAENLADGYIGEPAQVKRYGAVIRDEGRRLSEMVEQVLEVAGVQSGRKTYQLYPTDPRQIVEHALTACRLALVEPETTIETIIEDRGERLPMINADAPTLSRAIQNLISNAQKYGGENRWIGVRLEAVGKESGEGGEVRIAISDRGLGIPASELPHIFEPFYRGREVVAAQIHGSGLGLSLVRHIVDAHGGRIKVESESGKGTTITIILPAVEIKEPAVELTGDYGQASTAH